jgi:hypothetical protein
MVKAIRVRECRIIDNLKTTIVEDTIDQERFKELYGEGDLAILLERGRVGDAIGDGKWYYAYVVDEG